MNDWRLWAKAMLGLSVMGLTVGSLLPPRDVPVADFNDKFVHFMAYAVVGILAILAFRRTSHRVQCLLLLSLLGIALEFGQLMVPGRAFELSDMAANGCGTFAAFTTIWMIPAA